MEVSSSMERMSSHLKYSRYLIQQWWWECTYTSGHTPRYRMSSHLESTWGTRFKQTIMRVYVHRWSHTEVNTERHHNLTQVFWFPTCFMRTCVRGAMRMYGWQHTVLHKWIKETTQIWQGSKNKGVRIQGNQGTGVWWHANWKCERHVYTGPRGKTRKPSKHTVVTRHKCITIDPVADLGKELRSTEARVFPMASCRTSASRRKVVGVACFAFLSRKPIDKSCLAGKVVLKAMKKAFSLASCTAGESVGDRCWARSAGSILQECCVDWNCLSGSLS